MDVYINNAALNLANARVRTQSDLSPIDFAKFVTADQLNLNLYVADGAGGFVDLSTYPTIRVGIGNLDQAPTGGTCTFTEAGTASVAYNVGAAAMATAMDTVSGATTAVTAHGSNAWIVKFSAVGAQTLPTVDASALEPDTNVSVARLVTGDGTTKEEWLIRFFQAPYAYNETWSAITNGKSGSLNLGTENLITALGSNTSVAAYFEVELTDASGNVSTIAQIPVVVTEQVLGQGVAGSSNFDDYLTYTYESIIGACSDEVTSLTTGTAKLTFRMPYAMTLTGIRASVGTAPTGSTITVDVNETGSTILSTKLTIDPGHKTSTTATTPPVISDSSLADDAEITVDLDQIGSGTAGAGLKVYLNGYRTT